MCVKCLARGAALVHVQHMTAVYAAVGKKTQEKVCEPKFGGEGPGLDHKGVLSGPETSKHSMRTGNFPFVHCHLSVPRVVLGHSNYYSVNLR